MSDRITEMAFSFWKRVDSLNKKKLNELCVEANLDYNKVKHNRSDVRLMNCIETLAIAKSLNTTVEYLLTGNEERIISIADEVYEYMQTEMPSLLEDIMRKISLKKEAGSSANRA